MARVIAITSRRPNLNHANSPGFKPHRDAILAAEDKIRAIHAGKIVNGDPAELKAKLLAQEDEIEFLLGADYFEKRG